MEAFRDTIYKTIRARGFGLVIVIVTSALKTARSLVKDTCWRYYMHIGQKTPNCPVRSARTDLNILSRRQGIPAWIIELKWALGTFPWITFSYRPLRAEKEHPRTQAAMQPCRTRNNTQSVFLSDSKPHTWNFLGWSVPLASWTSTGLIPLLCCSNTINWTTQENRK